MEGSRDVDHPADIYSLGVVFYEMLTRELPLGHFSPSRKVQVDVRLDDVVLRTLEKEPRCRYQHASEFKKDVETISGMAPVRWQNRAMYGREYRSERQLFGWPLVHIANGIDPVTGGGVWPKELSRSVTRPSAVCWPLAGLPSDRLPWVAGPLVCSRSAD